MALPTKEQFDQFGMDSLDGIPQSAWDELQGPITVHMYSEEVKTNPRLEVSKANVAYILKQQEDIDVSGEIKKIEVDLTGPGTVLISFDGGSSYLSYTTTWETVDLSDIQSIRAKAMSAAALPALPEAAFAGRRQMRFAFFIDLENHTDVVTVSSVKLTTTPDSPETPKVGAIGVEIKELSIEGRLKELERMNSIQLAKMNFKAGAILNVDQLLLHNMQIDLFDTNSGEMIEVETGITVDNTFEVLDRETLEEGFLYRAEISTSGVKLKKVEII